MTDVVSTRVHPEHGSVFVSDPAADSEPPEWTDDESRRAIASTRHQLQISTFGDGAEVDLIVSLAEAAPGDADLDDWDQVVDASIDATGDELLVHEVNTDLVRLRVEPGAWRVRVHRTVFSPALESFRLVLWPAPFEHVRVLRAIVSPVQG